MPDTKYCSSCGAQHAASTKFCENCGAPRLATTTDLATRHELLSETEIRQIATAVASMDVDGSFNLSLSSFKFVEAIWADAGKDALLFTVTNPDQLPVETALSKDGWQVYDPGDGFDKSFEQDFECPDVESRARAIRLALDALVVTAGETAEFKKMSFSCKVDGVWEEKKYRIAK